MDNLGAIRIFVRVADELSFAAAARGLALSPSAVGKAVARLEHELGVRLFNRTTRRITLTAEAEAVLPHYRRLLAELDEARAVLESDRGCRHGAPAHRAAGHRLSLPDAAPTALPAAQS